MKREKTNKRRDVTGQEANQEANLEPNREANQVLVGPGEITRSGK